MPRARTTGFSPSALSCWGQKERSHAYVLLAGLHCIVCALADHQSCELPHALDRKANSRRGGVSYWLLFDWPRMRMYHANADCSVTSPSVIFALRLICIRLTSCVRCAGSPGDMQPNRHCWKMKAIFSTTLSSSFAPSVCVFFF